MQYDMDQVINRALYKKGPAQFELCPICEGNVITTIATIKSSVHYL